MIIDFHTHIFPPAIRDNRSHYLKIDPGFASLYSNPRAKLITADELIESMDKSGIEISVVLNFQWSTHDLCVETNNYILESMERYPDRLLGFCAVQLETGNSAIDEIERCAARGMRGVGELRPNKILFNFNKKNFQPVADILKKCNLISVIHASEPVGHNYPGKDDVTPDKLYPLLTGFPDLILVCAHWGGGLPFYALMPEVKKALTNVYFDSAASSFLYQPQIYQQVAQLVGPDKILFGTDYPLISPERLLREIESSGLPAKTQEMILSGNARRLLGLNIKGHKL